MPETKEQVFNSAIKLLNALACTPSEENQAVLLTARYKAASDGRLGCGYCCNSSGINIFDQDDFHIRLSPFSSSSGLLTFASGNTSVSVKIKYCPMCGRRL
jgi:hypothetical protein